MKRAKLAVKTHTLRADDCNYRRIEAKGYVKGIYIGFIAADAYGPPGGTGGGQSSPYMTICGADLKDEYTGRGYGHILYRRLAAMAARKGWKGIRSHSNGRNRYSNGAWKKIATKRRGKWDYLSPQKRS